MTDLRHIYKRRTSCKIVNLPINVSIQSIKANYFFKKKFKRAAPILLRCSLLLFREEFFILLLSIKRKTFPLHSFIFLILIIRWKTLDKRILTLSLIAFSLIVVITFLIFCVVLILFVMLLTSFLFYCEVVLT